MVDGHGLCLKMGKTWQNYPLPISTETWSTYIKLINDIGSTNLFPQLFRQTPSSPWSLHMDSPWFKPMVFLVKAWSICRWPPGPWSKIPRLPADPLLPSSPKSWDDPLPQSSRAGIAGINHSQMLGLRHCFTHIIPRWRMQIYQMAVSENGVFTMGFNHPRMAIWKSGKNVEMMIQTNTVTLNLFIPVLSSFPWKSCEM